VPALPSSVLEPLWVQVATLLPTGQVHHPLGCHRRRIPDRVLFDKLVQVLVFGCGYRRIADTTCSATTLRRRRGEWIALGLVDQLHRLTLAAYHRIHGLDLEHLAVDLEHLAVDGCTTKAPCGGQVAGPSPVDRRKQGPKRSLATQAHGVPLAVLPAPANRHRRRAAGRHPGCRGDPHRRGDRSAACDATVHLDAGYDDQTCRDVLAERGMVGQIATRGLPAPIQADRRWVVERTHAWSKQYGKLGLVHRAPPGRGRVLAAAGFGARRGRSARLSRLDLLPLGGPPPPTPLTAYWRRP
jgi:transposase